MARTSNRNTNAPPAAIIPARAPRWRLVNAINPPDRYLRPTAPRIHGELLKLGIDVGQATVERFMPWRPKELSPTWSSFLRNHMTDIAADPRRAALSFSRSSNSLNFYFPLGRRLPAKALQFRSSQSNLRRYDPPSVNGAKFGILHCMLSPKAQSNENKDRCEG
jgi:hypothetical protein